MKRDRILQCLNELVKENQAPNPPKQLPFPAGQAATASWAQAFSQKRNQMGQDTSQSTTTTAQQPYIDNFFSQYDRIGYLPLPSPEPAFCQFLYQELRDPYQKDAVSHLTRRVNERPLAWTNEMEMSLIVTTRNGLNAITTAVECYLKLPNAALEFRLQAGDPMRKEKNAPCDGVFVFDKNPGALVQVHPALVPRAASRASSSTSSGSTHNSHRSTSSTSSEASVHSNWVPPPPSRPPNDNTPSHHVCRYGYAEFKRTAVISDLLEQVNHLSIGQKAEIRISKADTALTAPQYVKVLSQVSN